MKYEFAIIVIFAATAVNNNIDYFFEHDGFNAPVKVNIGSWINLTFVLKKRNGDINQQYQEHEQLITIERRSMPTNYDGPQILCTFILANGSCSESEGCSCYMSNSSIRFTLVKRAEYSLNGTWSVFSDIANVSRNFDIVVENEVWTEENETIYDLRGSETSINLTLNTTSRLVCRSLQLLANLTEAFVAAEPGQGESCHNATDPKMHCRNVAIRSTQPWLVRVNFPDSIGERSGRWRLVLANDDKSICVNKYFQIRYVKNGDNSSLQSAANADKKDEQPVNIEKIAASVSVAAVLVILAVVSITFCIRRSMKNLKFRSSNIISRFHQGERPTQSSVLRDSSISVDINNHLYQDCRRPSKEEITGRYALTPQPHREMMEENPFGPRPSKRCHAPPETFDVEDRMIMKVIDFSRKPCTPLNVYVNAPNVRIKTRAKAKGAATKAKSLGNLYVNVTKQRDATENPSYTFCKRSISF